MDRSATPDYEADVSNQGGVAKAALDKDVVMPTTSEAAPAPSTNDKKVAEALAGEQDMDLAELEDEYAFDYAAAPKPMPLRLQRWYASLRPLTVDIVGDFAGHELFVVHGESLLRDCLGRGRVDFDNGFQLLHAIYEAEKFLDQLHRRKCNFHIIFFDSHAHLSAPPRLGAQNTPKALLARKILIAHLQRCLADSEHLVALFDSPEDPAFADGYLKDHGVQFFFVHDGGDGDGVNQQEQDQAIEYKSFMYWLASAGYSVGFLRNVSFRSSKAFAPIVSGSPDPVPPPVAAAPPKDRAETQNEHVSEVSAYEGLTARDVVLLSSIREYTLAHQSYDAQPILALIAQSLVLRNCSLAERRCAPIALGDPEKAASCASFLGKICTIAARLVADRHLQAPGLQWDVYDLIDGRIFISIVDRLASGQPLPDAMVDETRRLFGIALGSDARTQWDSLGAVFAPLTPSAPDAASKPPVPTVLPFKHPVVEDFLRGLNLAEAAEKIPAGPARIFADLTHWHNQKPVVRKLAPKLGFFAHKRKQKFMSDTMAYAASLTDSVGKIITPEVVIVSKATGKSAPAVKVSEKTAEIKKNDSKKVVNVKKTAKKGERDGKGAAKNRREGTGKEAALDSAKTLSDEAARKKEQSVTKGWQMSFKDLDQQTDPIKRYLGVAKFLNSLSKESLAMIGPDVHLYLCNILAQEYVKAAAGAGGRGGLGTVGALWNLMLSTASFQILTPEVVSGLGRLRTQLGLPMLALETSSSSRPLPFAIVPNIPPIPRAPVPFQLEHCGPYLARSFDSRPDPRVPFAPDAWQRKVLDAVDKDRSIFVVAPTSAGKTFISFYAMKQILQRDDDGVIVYVAPTKALVNQIAAEVVARFAKSYRSARCLWALKTRDYTINDPLQAQIFITVPHVLQIMLMSGANSTRPSSWARRVKRIIFDEVHCIGQAEDGVVWEQLLLMAPCPIIALSATVGNAAAFGEWLAGTQEVRGHKLEMITHNVRYSELRKFIYRRRGENTGNKTFAGLEKVDKIPLPGLDEGDAPDPSFQFVHPLAALTDRTRANFDDITLEPRDCLVLWEQMSKHQTAEFPVDKALAPEKCLPQIVAKADYVAWEARLKEAFCRWMHDGKSPFESVLEGLRQAGQEANVSKAAKAKVNDDGTMFQMLCDLAAQDALPVLVFNYDRHKCERRIKNVLDRLEDAEDKYKLSSAAWQRKMRGYRDWEREQAAKKARVATKTKAPLNSQDKSEKISKLDLSRDQAAEFSEWDLFDPTAPLEQFSFADSKKTLPSEFREMTKALEEEPIDPWFVRALRRGLGVHHAGMNRRYRSVLEILFRRGFCRVVVATGTLALGINMPCKTVVFDDQSIYLTALNYRQASGRAGRRGFDLLGNIVFFGQTKGRVYEIMSSRLPDLLGQFSLSTTLILRLLILLHETNNEEYASRATRALLSQSRLFLGGPEAEGAIRHHVRFSLDYLRRQHLVSSTGAPLNFAGLVSHLYFAENSVFALHALLKSGYFHELSVDLDRRPKEVLREMMLVLSHIFGRLPLHAVDSERIHRSSSVVVLPALPERAHEALTAHNRETLGIFENYVRSFAETNLADKPECKLPLTGQPVGTVTGPDTGGIFQSLPSTVIRSPFVALSGHGDDFSSIRDLCATVRSDVFLEESAVPYIAVWPEDDPRPLNAYLYDFFKHGSMAVLVRDNGIKAGDVWFLLRDFQLVLMTIVTSLRNFVGGEQEGGEDEETDYEVGPAGQREANREQLPLPDNKENVPVTMKQPEIPATREARRKLKVSDSWEDDLSEEESDEGGSEDGGENGAGGVPAWQQDGQGNLVKVLAAFEMLLEEFETTFRKVWA